MDTQNDQWVSLIAAYEEWIQDTINTDESKVYFLTFLFNHLGGKPRATLITMQQEVDYFYRTLLTRLIRRPRREEQRTRLPMLIAVPDRPVNKYHHATSLADITPNTGVHMHAILVIPKVSRLEQPLRRHIRRHPELYLGAHGKLRKIHVRRVKQLEDRVIDYTFKHVKRRTFSFDDVLILPRAADELSKSI
jgi:hypothetical protein